MESQLQLNLLKGVNQGVPPPENGFFENHGHVFKDRQFWFFAKLLILIVFYHIESQLQSDPFKEVNQGVPPLKTP